MHPKPRIARTFALLAVIALVAPFWGLTATAQVPGNATGAAAGSAAAAAHSVGKFDARPAGSGGQAEATGSVVSSVLADSTASAASDGVIRGFTIAQPDSSGDASAAGEVTVFERIDVAGFSPISRLEGVSTSQLTLKSRDLAITLTDSASALLVFKATGSSDQQITFTLPPGVKVEPATEARFEHEQVWHVQASGEKRLDGALVLVDAHGRATAESAGDIRTDVQGKAVATLHAGSQLVFRADTEYRASADAQADAQVEAYNEAVVEALASARLVAEATTEFSSGASLIAQANWFTSASARTRSDVDGRVETVVRGALDAALSASAAASASAQASQVLAYDLDHVDVPAQSAQQVGVFVDGALVARATSAADLLARAEAGQEAYWAHTVDGRVLVLAAAHAQANAAQTVTVAALGKASGSVSTLAELDAKLGVSSEVQGSYSIIGNLAAAAEGSGQVIGSFSSFFAGEAKGQAHVEHYADIRTSTEVFAKIELAAQAAAEATAQVSAQANAAVTAAASGSADAAQDVRMDTSVAGEVLATATFSDSVLSTIQATAHAATTARFTLSEDVRATQVNDHVVRLDGPNGRLGYLILADAQGGAEASHDLQASAQGAVEAQMEAGETIVYRASAEAQARVNAEANAKAIAAGSLASELMAGASANAYAAASADYQSDVHSKVDAAASAYGKVAYDVKADAAQRAVVALTADRATLPAASASDILVKVNGQAATRVATAAEVFAAASAAASADAAAKYAVSTDLSGQTQIVTSLVFTTAATAKVVVESSLAAEAKAKAALDVFGSFRAGYGGAASGDIVGMVVKPEAGLILDYTVNAKTELEAKATKVFDAIQVVDAASGEAAAMAQASASTAASVKYASEVGAVEAFDVSGAVLKVTAAARSTATFDLAQNVEARALAENANVLMLSSKDKAFSGALILVQSAQATGEAAASAQSSLQASAAASADASAEVTARLEAGAVLVFKAFSGFESEISQAEKEAQAKAIASGKLLGQVIVTTEGASTTTANVNYYADAHVQAVTQIATAEKVQVVVDSSTHFGKSIILSLDRDTVSGLFEGDAKLYVDGRALTQASSYADALEGNGDKYWLITTEAGVGLQAIVSLAHFSTRTITLEAPEGVNLWVWTSAGLGAVVVGQALWPMMRRKK